MRKEDEIEDSLKFCQDIRYYTTMDKEQKANQKTEPKNQTASLEDCIQWVNQLEDSIHKEYETIETYVDSTEQYQKKKAYRANIAATAEPTLAMNEMTKEKEKNGSLLRDFIEIIACILITVAIVIAIDRFVITNTEVSGYSMETSLEDGDHLLINRIVYRFKEPELFDVVVFRNDKESDYIKRIIGLPGQTVQIIDGRIYINDVELKETFGKEPINNPGLASDKITLAEDEYFVLGDNRNGSTDSRYAEVGNVHRSQILGKACFRIYPFTNLGGIE